MTLDRRAGLKPGTPPQRRTRLERGPGPARVTELPRSNWQRTAPVIPIRPNPAWRPAPVVPITSARSAPGRVHAASGQPKLPLGFPPPVRELIVAASGGRCVLARWREPGVPDCWGPLEAHHRDSIGAGGTSLDWKHDAGNGLLLCAAHHVAWVHAHPGRARILGLIVGMGLHFKDVPVSFDGGVTWWRLEPGTGARLAPEPEDDDAA